MRIINLKFISTLLFIGLLPLSANGAESQAVVQDSWLNKMLSAVRHTNYSGTFIYQSGSYIEASRLTHLFDGKNEYERLEGLEGERSEVIRKNDQVWCYLGDSKVMVAKRNAARTFPALLPEQLSLLRENYELSYGESERVAEILARTIVFKPRDKMRYAHKMWADSETGLLLKAVVMDEYNHVIEQYAFTQLKLGGDMDRKWLALVQSSNQMSAAIAPGTNLRAQASESGWRAYFVPAGFKKIIEVTRRIRDSSGQVTHIVYSDGLAGVSVFIEKWVDKAKVRQGLSDMGVRQVFVRIVDDNVLTVVGEVPPRTLLQIADSVRDAGVKE